MAANHGAVAEHPEKMPDDQFQRAAKIAQSSP
jgi:hypothetical protein